MASPAADTPVDPAPTTARLAAVRRVLGLTLLVTLLASRPLWLGHPIAAPVPLWSGVPWSPLVGVVAYAALLGLAAAVVVTGRRGWTLACLALLLLRCAWDRMTWQPYLLQYAVMLAILATVPRGAVAREREALAGLRMVLACIYFWSGFAKAHARYFSGGGTPFLRPLLDLLPPALAHAAVVAIPFVEMALAVALAFARTRRIGMAGFLAMHALILVQLGPLGIDYNRIVWPWNVAMIAFLLLLFRGPVSVGRVAVARPAALVAVTCTGLLPALSYVGLWDEYLSFRLYAQRQAMAYLLLTERGRAQLPPDLDLRPEDYGQRPPWTCYARIVDWVDRELGVLPPPVPAVYRALGGRLLERMPQPDEAALLIQHAPEWDTGRIGNEVLRLQDLRR